MKKTKAMLLKEFNSLQKDYLKAVREGHIEDAQEILETRRRLQLTIRKVDERYVKRK